jgi:hypothetical protein
MGFKSGDIEPAKSLAAGSFFNQKIRAPSIKSVFQKIQAEG